MNMEAVFVYTCHLFKNSIMKCEAWQSLSVVYNSKGICKGMPLLKFC